MCNELTIVPILIRGASHRVSQQRFLARHENTVQVIIVFARLLDYFDPRRAVAVRVSKLKHKQSVHDSISSLLAIVSIRTLRIESLDTSSRSPPGKQQDMPFQAYLLELRPEKNDHHYANHRSCLIIVHNLGR